MNILQDESGFLWFGTDGGLSKFDGYTFKNFYGHELDTASIPAGLITTICKDANGLFWIGSYTDGVSIFNPISEVSRRISYLQGDSLSYFNNQVTSIIQDQSGNIWIGTLNGLNCYDPKTKTSVHFENDPSDSLSLSSNGIRKLFIDHNGVLWVGTGNWNNWEHYPGGLNRYDPSTKTFKRYITDDITSIKEDNNNVLYIGTAHSLLYRYNRNKDLFELWWKLKNFTKPSPQLGPNSVNLLPAIFDFEQDRPGNFWIGSCLNGVYKISPTTNSIQHFEYNTQKINSLSANTVGSIFQDEQGIMWIGTDAGVNKVVPSQKRFSQLRSKPEILTELGNRRVHSFLKDSQRNLWMGLANGDLYCFDGSSTNHWNIQKEINNKPSPLSLIYEDKQKELWLSGTGCGLIQFSPEKGILKRFTPNAKSNSSLTFWQITAIVQDGHGNLWLSGGYNGIDIFNPNTETFVNYRNNKQNSRSRSISNDIVSSIIKDSDNQIWIGTKNGLNLYREKTNDFDRFLPGVDIRKIFVDSIGRFWIGTQHQGLILFNRQTGTYKTYTKDDGLPSNFTNNIVEDNDGNIWIGSPSGLTRFQPESESFVSFDAQDGVDNVFTLEPDAAVKLQSGEILFSGTKGITSFSPENIKINKFPPKVVITDVAIFKNSISRKTNIDSTIEFNFDQNDLTFEYVGLHFANPSRNTYAVKLEPYEKDWQYVGTLRKARYTSLQPGSYTFSVKAANSDGVWSDGTKSIKFIILPPWWKTWWAYSFYVFIVFVFLYSTRKFELNRQRKNSEIKESKLKAEAAELHIKTAEAQAKVIQAENDRKTKELEQAKEIEKAYTELKSTQSQLIQSEKMASLGELTAGIAHEIQNPLNFVNNFSELNNELIDELSEEVDNGNLEEVKAIAKDIKENGQKINHHGKRADSIVKGMLLHSRRTSGEKTLTDINDLVDQYVDLAFHGMRAKDQEFNITIEKNYDKTLEKINVVPQDMSRVFLNIINNASYAAYDRKKRSGNDFNPVLKVSTKKSDGKVEIRIGDNGNGIPADILDKIFQPFFTTKPTGEGTGLGLSLSYDIVTKVHGGELKVETKEGVGSEFIIQLPLN